jgi:hypothetical protein
MGLRDRTGREWHGIQPGEWANYGPLMSVADVWGKAQAELQGFTAQLTHLRDLPPRIDHAGGVIDLPFPLRETLNAQWLHEWASAAWPCRRLPAVSLEELREWCDLLHQGIGAIEALPLRYEWYAEEVGRSEPEEDIIPDPSKVITPADLLRIADPIFHRPLDPSLLADLVPLRWYEQAPPAQPSPDYYPEARDPFSAGNLANSWQGVVRELWRDMRGLGDRTPPVEPDTPRTYLGMRQVLDTVVGWIGRQARWLPPAPRADAEAQSQGSAGPVVPMPATGEPTDVAASLCGPQPPNHFCWRGESVEVTNTEWSLAVALWENVRPGRPVLADFIIEKVWKKGANPSRLKTTIHRLNQKIGDTFSIRYRLVNGHVDLVNYPPDYAELAGSNPSGSR